MKEQVTVVPADKLVVVDGIGLELEFSTDENLHAVQWAGSRGHCEYADEKGNRELKAGDYEKEVAPFVALWEAEMARLEQARAEADAEYSRPENVAARQLAAAKAERAEAVAAITVEVDGMVFDGDERAQERMARAVTMAESPDERTEWVLHDHSVAVVTAQQLRRACRAAGKAQTALWTVPYR